MDSQDLYRPPGREQCRLEIEPPAAGQGFQAARGQFHGTSQCQVEDARASEQRCLHTKDEVSRPKSRGLSALYPEPAVSYDVYAVVVSPSLLPTPVGQVEQTMESLHRAVQSTPAVLDERKGYSDLQPRRDAPVQVHREAQALRIREQTVFIQRRGLVIVAGDTGVAHGTRNRVGIGVIDSKHPLPRSPWQEVARFGTESEKQRTDGELVALYEGTGGRGLGKGGTCDVQQGAGERMQQPASCFKGKSRARDVVKWESGHSTLQPWTRPM